MLRRVHREEERLFLLEGPVALAEAVDAGASVEGVFVDADLGERDEIERVAGSAGARVWPVSAPVIKALADTTTPRGVVSVARMPGTGLDALPTKLALALVLVAVRDPGNVGTLMRSALGAGADAVIVCEGSADPFASKTVRAAAGAALRLRLVVHPGFAEVAAALKERGLRLVGADAGADRAHNEGALEPPVAIVLGNEGWGIPTASRSLLDETVAITMPGPAESLNVAMAGSILLFEVVASDDPGRVSSRSDG